MGKDASAFHHAATDDETAIGTQYVAQARTWFDSVWKPSPGRLTRPDD